MLVLLNLWILQACEICCGSIPFVANVVLQECIMFGAGGHGTMNGHIGQCVRGGGNHVNMFLPTGGRGDSPVTMDVQAAVSWFA